MTRREATRANRLQRLGCAAAILSTALWSVSGMAGVNFSAPFRAFDITRPEGGCAPQRSMIVRGDFNQDGRLDLATADGVTSCQGSVRMLLGQSDGTLGPVTVATSGPDYRMLAAGDFNSDGKLDLVACAVFPYNASVLLGNGDGTFRPRTDYPLDAFPTAVAVGQLLRDAALDFVVAYGDEGTVKLFRGVGDGSFVADGTFPASPAGYTGPGLRDLVVADVTRDGRPDIIVTNSNYDQVAVLPAKGKDSFGPAKVAATGYAPSAIAVADMNGDARPDLVVANGGGESISVLRGNGDGTFGARRDYPTLLNVVDLELADLNGDGSLDVCAASVMGRVAVLLGAKNATLGSSQDFLAAVEPCSMAAGDFDGDGRVDVAVSIFGINPTHSFVSLLHGNGNGTLGGGRFFAAAGDPRLTAVGDLNDDGHLDLVANEYYTWEGQASVFLGDGTGGLSVVSNFTMNCQTMVLSDINLDGKLDLIGANDGAALVRLGTGTGFFGPEVVYPAPARALAVGDVNGDGKPDLVTAGFFTNTVAVLLGNGDGTFGAVSQFPSGLNPISVALADMNSDGRLDIVVGKNNDANGILLGNGDGTFAPRLLFFGGSTVAIADMNGDGKLDVVSSRVGGHEVALVPGNGDGTLAPWFDYPCATSPNGVAVADMDLDGKSDVVVSTAVVLSVLSGNPDGTLGANNDFGGPRYMVGPAIGDFDEDGRPDLIAVGGGGVWVLKNLTGTGVLAARATPAAGRPASASPKVISLASVSPNPMNPTATLHLKIERSARVTVRMFDVSGRLVRTIWRTKDAAAGVYAIPVDGRDDGGASLASGVYYYRIEAGTEKMTGRLAIVQ